MNDEVKKAARECVCAECSWSNSTCFLDEVGCLNCAAPYKAFMFAIYEAYLAGYRSSQAEISELREAVRWIPVEDRDRPMPNDVPILIKDENGRVYTWEEWDSYDQAPPVLITHWRLIDIPNCTTVEKP